jgi:hypothetical protein
MDFINMQEILMNGIVSFAHLYTPDVTMSDLEALYFMFDEHITIAMDQPNGLTFFQEKRYLTNLTYMNGAIDYCEEKLNMPVNQRQYDFGLEQLQDL